MPPKKTHQQIICRQPLVYPSRMMIKQCSIYDKYNTVDTSQHKCSIHATPKSNKNVSQQKKLHQASPQNLKNKKWELDKFALSGIIRHSHNISKIGSQHNYWASSHKPNENGIQHNFLVGGIPQCLYEIQWEPTRFASSNTKNVFPRVVCCSGMQEVRGAIFILLGR